MYNTKTHIKIMVNQENYKQELLKTWEETYKKGQLTLWLLLSLKNKPRYVSDIKEYVQSITESTISCEEQSLYRALRKFHDLEIVDYEFRAGNKGPDRKYYSLTSLGYELLEEFIQRNIRILYNKKLVDLLLNAGEHHETTKKKL